MAQERHITVLDCTLRDGSYVIDNQFTADDTYLITTGLERAGFSLIEVGHGTGLGSYRRSTYEQAASDVAYIEAAIAAIRGSQAKIGMFFIPGIGTMEDLELAAKTGMHFIRIGTNVTDIEIARPFIERAKSLGLLTCSNLMKSYAVTPKEFAVLARRAADFGADIISIVDSAGGMFPEDIREYVLNLRDVTEKKIGFHGHNNLHLSIANTLAAVDAGAEVIDSTLQGMGRSAGNTQTEIIVLALEKKGYSTGIDAFRAMDLGEKVVKSMMCRAQGIDDISVISGIAQFHSSFLKIVEDAAKKHDVDTRLLILKVSERSRTEVTRELAEEVAQELSKKKGPRSEATAYYGASFVLRERTPIQRMDDKAGEIIALSKKTGKNSVLSMTIARDNKTSFPYVRQNAFLVIGNVEAASVQEAASFIELLDGRVDWLCVDNSCAALRESGLLAKVTRSNGAWYSEGRALSLSLEAFLTGRCAGGTVLALCDEDTLRSLQMNLKHEGIKVVGAKEFAVATTKQSLTLLKAIVSFAPEYCEELTSELAQGLSPDVMLLAVRPDAFPGDFLSAASARSLSALRVDIRPGLNAELSLAIETKRMTNLAGEREMDGIRVVAGGIIGYRGSIVVDSIIEPRRVIGVADGRGGLLNTQDEVAFVPAKEKILTQLMPRV